MGVVGFHYLKMSAEKKNNFVGKVNVSNNVSLNSVKEAKVNLGKDDQKAIEFKFTYKANYEPDVASIVFEGAAVFLSKGPKITETLALWEKEKKLPPEVIKEVYNYILEKCTIQGLILGKEMQFPPNVPLPKVSEPTEPKKGKKESKK
jgi:hypothetical protein